MAMELWRQAEMLRKVRRGITDLDLSRERVRTQITALELQEAKLAGQAVKAREMGRDDLAAQRLQTKIARCQFGLDDTDGEA